MPKRSRDTELVVSSGPGGDGNMSRSTALTTTPGERSAKRAAPGRGGALVEVPRTSDLFAPIVRLEGHKGAVNGVRFSPDGQNLASVSADKTVMLWRVFGEDCANYGVLEGHTNAVQEGAWTEDGERIVTCSADKSVRVWDCRLGEEVAARRDHRAFVNCAAVSALGTVASGGDDSMLRLWDPREGLRAFARLKHPFEVTSCAFSSAATAIPLVHTGSVDGIVRTWDVRKRSVLFQMEAPEDAPAGVVTGVSCSEGDDVLVTNDSSGAVRTWDARPFAGNRAEGASRLKQSLVAHTGTPPLPNKSMLLLRCDVSRSQDRATAGSSGSVVHVWSLDSGEVEFALPGHRGPILDSRFHPSQPIVASCSVDKCIFLGELDRRDI
ncbi:WD repeat-containing protein wdr-5.1 [Hondaea fermentalgiana]|uniref:WD repeat-containing protein wdr-5.1 n=1 Tax=Hondaea fermentalgiana TaxID=2315210 RepID=A0A2R5G9C4_9STRA|nr:WD repeat-containing protein wdr-5.1 [Hondaea fermentalgiana]|eukprot:GBG27652.1 WD repeat-containing protein wdr-5.1 [Hondaea fermentalgiana]